MGRAGGLEDRPGIVTQRQEIGGQLSASSLSVLVPSRASPPILVWLVVFFKEASVLFFQSLLACGFCALPTFVPLLGIVFFVFSGELGLGLYEPVIEGLSHFLGPLGFFCEEVVLLRLILAQVVELIPSILVVVNEFPFVLHDDGARLAPLVSVMGVVPKQGPLGNGFTLEQRDEADPIDLLLLGQGNSAEFKDCGIPIDSANRNVTHGTGLGYPGRLEVKGFANPAFPLAALSTAQG